MNANDLLRQRMLEALASQDSANKQLSGGLPTDQAAEFQKLPPDLQKLALTGGQQSGQGVTAGLSPSTSYMRDANRENVDARYQDYADDASKSSDDTKWERVKALLAAKASQ